MISLLINTCNRYDNINRILETQIEYQILSEVIVFNNGNQDIGFTHRKLKVIRANYDVGLRSRWILGALARNNCLFVQDDDIQVTESVFDIIHGNYLFDYDKIYGIFGRKLLADGTYDLNSSPLGDVDVLLTRLACFDKTLIPYLLEAEERVIPGRYPSARDFPYDDILLSYASQALYNKKPYVVKIDDFDKCVKELKDENGLHQQPGYMERRRDIIATCRRNLLNEETKYPKVVSK